ncbi:MAG: DUF6526 family protein [Bacteroidota bacterium]|nr:DUF6526 family protein [Bacteroidota bacterium]
MQIQNYKSHRQYLPMYHIVLLSLILVILGCSVWNFYRAYNHLTGRLTAALIFGLSLVSVFFYIYVRSFALKAQDRAIRAEENFRHFVLTGKPLDSRLRLGQIIALRFAHDDEFVSLAQKAADENMKANDIKKAIQNWRADHHRL